MFRGQVLCPALLGRSEELRTIAGALESAQARRGSMVLVLGEAGMGKSSLAREAAAQARSRGLSVLSGRAIEGRSPSPFRPLAEALVSVFRGGDLRLPPALEPFRPALGRILPHWRQPGHPAGDESDVVLGEGVLQLLRLVAKSQGCLLVLEDLHWADPETLSVLEYLSDNVQSQPVVCLGTLRSEEPSRGLSLACSLAARRSATLVELGPLSDADVRLMARACLNTLTLPAAVDDVLLGRGDGIPFLIEELLATSVGTGALTRDDSEWVLSTELDALVPLTFADSIRRRMSSLGDVGQEVLRTAAVFGRHFDWTLLTMAVRLDEQTVLTSLRGAVEAQLVVAGTRNTFRFRHSLTRDAVLSELLPGEHAALVSRALSALEAAHPELDGEWRELAAQLCEEAGDPVRAATLLLEAGRRALSQGALATSESTLDRAARLASTDPKLAVEIAGGLVEVLSLAGKTEQVFEVGDALLTSLAGLPDMAGRHVEVHLGLARAASTASRWRQALKHLEQARSLASSPGQLARIDALAAHVALGQSRLDDAVRLADVALAVAERAGLPEVACEALEVIGRRARLRDLSEAELAFERALSIAREHDLRLWWIRALHELGTIDMLSTSRVDRLIEARDLAYQAGALATVATLDLQLASLRFFRFEIDESLLAARRCAEVAERFRLGLALPAALLQEAACHAVSGRRMEMEHVLRDALRLGAEDLSIGGGAWLHCRASLSVFQEDRQRAQRELDTGLELLRQSPDTLPYPFRGLWALLRTLEDRDGYAAREEVRTSGVTVVRLTRAYLLYADAVALGRAGHQQKAHDTFRMADAELALAEKSDAFRHLGRRLVAEAAVEDGWGEPVEWLKEAVGFFEGTAHHRLVSACRSLLQKAGAPVSRKGRGDSAVPPELRCLGVTSREVDVLVLVAARLSNREIAARLYLSPRTVEKHVESLMAKTGSRARTELAALAERIRSS